MEKRSRAESVPRIWKGRDQDVLGGPWAPQDGRCLPQGGGHDECGESRPRVCGGLTKKFYLLTGGPQVDAFRPPRRG